MLVLEYMSRGSLYDLLHNKTVILEGEDVLHILRDIARGMRFLHAAKPAIIRKSSCGRDILFLFLSVRATLIFLVPTVALHRW